MKNFKKILSKLSVIFLLFYSQIYFHDTDRNPIGKAYLAEMIDIASEIMEKKQSIDPDSLQYKRRNIKVLYSYKHEKRLYELHFGKIKSSFGCT